MKHFILVLTAILFWGVNEVKAQPSAALVADAESGYLLIKDNVQKEMPPASLTKVMTLYLTFGALEKGWLKWDDLLPVSAHAANQPRTNLGLQTGQTISVKEAVLALIVHSANDAAVVLAESMAPSEQEFAQIMTQSAKTLNMPHTIFKNASGLHVAGQKTTAQDMAILTLAVIKHFPSYYPLFATTDFDFNGQTYKSHNKILNEYEGAEGLKTGYVSAVGYNIISTAKKDNVRLVGVVMGKETSKARDKQMKKLLDKGFQKASIQKQAVKNGKLNPAFDPLHRKAFLKKLDLSLFSAQMQRQIAHAKVTAQLLADQNKLLQAQMQLQNDALQLEGWSVQVGAFQSLDKAREMAARAFSLLGQTSVYATTDFKDSLYRSKLVGFADKKCAQNACKELKRQACSCFLVAPEKAQGDE